MARAAITPIELGSLYPTAFINLTTTAGNAVDGQKFKMTGREVLIVKNTSVDTPYDATILATPDNLGRTTNLVFEIPFGETRAVMVGKKGYVQNDGQLYFNSEHAALVWTIVRLPAQFRA